MTNHTNLVFDATPLMNLTGVSPGVCASQRWIPVTAPNMSAVGAGGGPVFTSNISSTVSVDNTTPLNLTAMGLINPTSINPNYTMLSTKTAANVTSSSTSSMSTASASSKSSAGLSEYSIPAVTSGIICLLLTIVLI
ncbi:hypothetical protein QFC22_006301 [Naganishia vaughanmartiniae]|uniref:Uncharacterized protein n=1 Tax=Naganishia vaughanmartiniae TaxID=1424756 RepID=A0ACC2WNY7_9TREE|nr:hypothetical protein QFC22_006301 [Naganishia vaughanmartiniae]